MSTCFPWDHVQRAEICLKPIRITVYFRCRFFRCRSLTSCPQKLMGQSSPNFVYCKCRRRRLEIVNFITPTPRGSDYCVKIVKIMYFIKNFFYSGAYSIETKCLVMMTKRGFTKIVIFITPGAEIMCRGVGI